MYIYVYIYIYIYICTCITQYLLINIFHINILPQFIAALRARAGTARGSGVAAVRHRRGGGADITPGFHNFNLRIFNLRVSDPNKFIVDAFLTRCRISMCQSLGPTKTL